MSDKGSYNQKWSDDPDSELEATVSSNTIMILDVQGCLSNHNLFLLDIRILRYYHETENPKPDFSHRHNFFPVFYRFIKS